MTARVITLDVTGNLDGVTLIEEFEPGSVGPTAEDRALDIFRIKHTGNVGFFRVATLLKAIPGFESADVYFPQVQFKPGPNELLDLIILGPELEGAGIRAPVVNANSACIYAERRGGIRMRSSNLNGFNQVSFLICPLTTQEQIIQASCCFCEVSLGRPCVPPQIDSVGVSPVIDPGPPPVVGAVPITVALGSSGGTFTPSDIYVLERTQDPDGNADYHQIFAGPASTFTDATAVELLFTPTAPADTGTYRLRAYRSTDPNCGAIITDILKVTP